MKTKELQKLTDAELKKALEQNQERLRSLRFDLASGKVKNVREIRETRKTVARVLTLLKERKIHV
ncbi:MAG TPA: 50S ribosomal protein L29 [Candidatus Paceibacterota bacterium]|nr:50S ribosomal protein L29 [Candidatus Paceibacterota bacterium]HRY76723.1 50S ribosomal protein L29 [Candidatus Paceibacterota bacterium]